MANSIRAKYLQGEIQRLQGAIAHLEEGGIEIYNNAPPHAFEETSPQKFSKNRERIL